MHLYALASPTTVYYTGTAVSVNSLSKADYFQIEPVLFHDSERYI